MTNLRKGNLYQHLGGRDAVARIVKDWFERMKHDPDIRLFHGLSAARRRASTRATIAYLSAVTSRSGDYSSSQQEIAQSAMGLMSCFWLASAAHLMQALAHNGVPNNATGEFISWITGLREQLAATTPSQNERLDNR